MQGASDDLSQALDDPLHLPEVELVARADIVGTFALDHLDADGHPIGQAGLNHLGPAVHAQHLRSRSAPPPPTSPRTVRRVLEYPLGSLAQARDRLGCDSDPAGGGVKPPVVTDLKAEGLEQVPQDWFWGHGKIHSCGWQGVEEFRARARQIGPFLAA